MSLRHTPETPLYPCPTGYPTSQLTNSTPTSHNCPPLRRNSTRFAVSPFVLLLLDSSPYCPRPAPKLTRRVTCPIRAARLLLHPSQARSSPSYITPFSSPTDDSATEAHTLSTATSSRQASKPKLEARCAHAIYSRTRCLFVFLADRERSSSAPRRAPLAPSEPGTLFSIVHHATELTYR